MKNVFKCAGIIVMVAVIGFSVIGCSNGSTDQSYNNDPGGFAGTWTGSMFGYVATVTISTSGYTINVPAYSYYYDGNFSRTGDSATLYNDSNQNIGTMVLQTPTTAKVTLNNNSDAPGTYTFTKS